MVRDEEEVVYLVCMIEEGVSINYSDCLRPIEAEYILY